MFFIEYWVFVFCFLERIVANTSQMGARSDYLSKSPLRIFERTYANARLNIQGQNFICLNSGWKQSLLRNKLFWKQLGVSLDVTKIQTSKLLVLLKSYFHDV